MNCLNVSKQDGVTTLTLNRAEKRNALSAELVACLQAEIDICAGDETQLLVLKGEGRGFCAGFDLASLADEDDAGLVLRFIRIEQLLQALHRAPFDTLAFAHGASFGAGADIICACARRVATPDAIFRMPGLRFGLLLGSRRLARRIGPDAAYDLLLSGRAFGAAEAADLGFVQAIHDAGEFDALVRSAAIEARGIDPATRARLAAMVRENSDDQDLADLVRSAAAPGLKARLQAYAAALPGAANR